VLRRVFGTDEEEVAGGRRKFHNELLNLHVFARYDWEDKGQ
jgi:hypothetical protein